MATDTEETVSSDKHKEIEAQEVNLQYHLYIVFFATIYFGSFFIPGIVYMLYFLLIFQPYVLDNPNFLSLFTELNSLLALILFPLVMIISYILHLVFIGVFTRLFWRFTEKMCPTKDGIILRSVPSDTLNYYHLRSFMIKYGKYAFTKGMFPWLANWLYNFVGSNKIGKGTTIVEEADRWVGRIRPLEQPSFGYIQLLAIDNNDTKSVYPKSHRIQIRVPQVDSTGLVINEFLASNTSVNTDPAGEYDDWLEIYNSSNEEISLVGLYLTDNS